MTAHTKTLARLTGFLIGTAACLALVLAGHVAGGASAPTAGLTVRSESTGALAVHPAGAFLSSRDVRPAGAADAARERISVRSLSAVPMAVRVRAVPAGEEDLAELLVAELSVDGEPLFRGSFAELRHWTARSFHLRPRQSRKLEVRAWLPRSTGPGYEFRTDDVTLEWKVRAA